MQTSIFSHQGPRPYQEDSASVDYNTIAGIHGSYLMQATVADGVGAESGGAEAGQLVTRVMPQRVVEQLRDCEGDLTHEVMAAAGKQAAVDVYPSVGRDIQSRAGFERAATTLLHVMYWWGIAIVTAIGDSAAWLYKPRTRRVQPVNRLHKLVDVYVLRGEISDEEARVHPQRNVVTTAVGVKGAIRIDQYAKDVEEGDVIVLMSDGVSESIPPEQAADIIRQAILHNAFSTVAQGLVQAALTAGSRDNCTAVALLIEPSDVPVKRPVSAETLAIGLETRLHERLARKENHHED
jgi:protein phosphatase